MDRRRELKEQYKQMKPEMGIIIVRSKKDNKAFMETSNNLKGYINKTKFQLELGSHLNDELQKHWNDQGEENFIIEILETLEYDKDESKTDYSKELEVMKYIWTEKLAKENVEFY